jgi:4-azaleucine resistance transporter AzlC
MVQWREVRQGIADMAPVLVAASPIGLLWGTLAAAHGFSPLEAGLMSALVFAGAAQFVAIELWREPVPILLLTLTALIVNMRHVLMGASLSRHLSHIGKIWHPLIAFLMVDENWAFSERRVLKQRLTLSYFMGMAIAMYLLWVISSVIGAVIGKSLGDPAAFGIDFAFSALFIGILAGFWKGSRTAVVLAASAICAALAKSHIPGAWYIVIGGLAGVLAAALLYREGSAEP